MTEVKLAADESFSPLPQLVEEDYKEFNIILCGGKYYALAQDEGGFDIKLVYQKRYSRFFSGNSVDEVKQLIDQSIKAVDTGTEISISESLIATVTKAVIRRAINRTDIERWKRATVEKIRNVSDKGYRGEMNKIFNDIESMGVKNTWGLARDSSKEEVIKVIEAIDKETLLKKLDEISDQAIARLVKKKFCDHKLNRISQLIDFLNKRYLKYLRKPLSE